jgi:hypothetical protein
MGWFKQRPQADCSRPDSSRHLRSTAITEKELTELESAEQFAQCGVLIFWNGKWYEI